MAELWNEAEPINEPRTVPITVTCSRCCRSIEGVQVLGLEPIGFYDVGAGRKWAKFADPTEEILCDACMHADPRYISEYFDHWPESDLCPND